MKITSVEVVRLLSEASVHSYGWETRMPQCSDVYAEWNTAGPDGTRKESTGMYRANRLYVEIGTDVGLTGVFGPITPVAALLVIQDAAPFLLGRDPLPVTLLYDQLNRRTYAGRTGDWQSMLGAVDCALWDLRGRAYGQPVCALLGGPTRATVRAGAAGLNLSHAPELLRERAEMFRDAGFANQKWFLRHGPGSGVAGMKENLRVAETLRDVVGAEGSFALDVWTTWPRRYAVEMCRELEPLRPAWIEEPLPADDLDGYKFLRQSTSLALAAGEHLFTVEAALGFLEAGVLDYFQMDIAWCGGITGALALAHLAQAYRTPLVPHSGCPLAVLQLAAALPLPAVLEFPWVPVVLQAECLPLVSPPEICRGEVTVPISAGMGFCFDSAKIRERRPVSVGDLCSR